MSKKSPTRRRPTPKASQPPPAITPTGHGAGLFVWFFTPKPDWFALGRDARTARLVALLETLGKGPGKIGISDPFELAYPGLDCVFAMVFTVEDPASAQRIFDFAIALRPFFDIVIGGGEQPSPEEAFAKLVDLKVPPDSTRWVRA